jgi:hypothetical protein
MAAYDCASKRRRSQDHGNQHATGICSKFAQRRRRGVKQQRGLGGEAKGNAGSIPRSIFQSSLYNGKRLA